MYYPNGFLEKKNCVKTRPGSDFSFMSYRKGERNALWIARISGLIGQISGLRGPGGDRWMDGRMNGWMDGRTDGRTDRQTNERKSPCVLQDFVPFGAAALLPLTPIHNHAKQGNGYR